MVYKQFQDLKLSALGFGCMRFPVTEDKQIDEERTREMIDLAIRAGVNYFDTAWPYHGGNSEIVTGKILRDYPRDRYYIATKFPGFNRDNLARKEEIFQKQLEKTGMEYFDFYLLHNVCERNVEGYLSEEYGMLPFLLEQKKQGRIRHLGFSTHAALPTLEHFLDVCGSYMEFCQIELNWLDWSVQEARAKVELLNRRGLPIWVMEPLRGGKLVDLPQEDRDALHALSPHRSLPAWSFRFLQGVEGVTMILSGMSAPEQVQENLDIFSQDLPLQEEERQVLFRLARKLTGGVPCTACRYCTEYCPQGLEIPELLRLYNNFRYDRDAQLTALSLGALPEGKRPENCIRCRSCEAACPQNISIPEELAAFREELDKALAEES